MKRMNKWVVAGVLVAEILVAVGAWAEPGAWVTVGGHGGVQLWEGGPYWAETNIGAEKPWEYGLYFWWGDTVGYKWENNAWVASDGAVSNFAFSEENTPTYNKSESTLLSEGWIVSKDETYILAPEHDAAQLQWGGGWRMPTYQELYDLCYNQCDWTWMRTNGVNGYVVRGRGDFADGSIFVPAAGYGVDRSSLFDAGVNGDLCSSVPISDNTYNSWSLNFYSDLHHMGYGKRYLGFSIRPVRGDAEEPPPAGGGTWKYSVSNGVATVTGAEPAEGDLVIPAELGGCPVGGIGNRAFYGCSGLTSVTIGNSATNIGGWAFCDCSALTNVTIPDSVTGIRWYAFSGCSGLTSVMIPNSVTSIGDDVFYGCSGLTNVTIGNSVTNIGGYAFYGCNGLTNVTIPDSVTGIRWYAFCGCSGLTSVTIPNSVTSIGDYAFYYCSGLTSVLLPDSVTSIGSYVFSCCSGLATLSVPASWAGTSMLANAGLPLGCEVVYRDVPPAVEVTWKYSVSNGVATVTGAEPAVGELAIPAELGGYPVTSIGDKAFSGCSGLTSVTIPDSVTNTGSYTFLGCSGLMNVTIPDSLTSIGGGVFCDCSGLTNVTIPDSVTSIKDSAFRGCSGLTSMTIPASVKSIGEWAFTSCRSIESFSVATGNPAYKSESGLLLTKDGRTLVCGVNGEVVIPDGVMHIGDKAFYGYSGLMRVTIPDSVTSINYLAFAFCESLESFSVSNGNPAYKSDSGLLLTKDGKTLICGVNGEVVIPNSVRSIRKDAFFGFSGLASVLIPDCVISIGHGAFGDCTGLTSVTIPDGVTSLGEQVFSDCTALTNVVIGNSVTSIEGWAFVDCSGLKSVTIGNSVTNIGHLAFYGCGGLTAVHIHDLASWCGISSSGNNPLSYAHHLYLDGKEIVGDLAIPDGVTSIGSTAFSGCSGLTSVTIPDSVTSIGWNAFYGCSSLYDTSTLPGVSLVDGWAVDATNSLSGFLDLTGVRGISDLAFGGCSGLTSVMIPDNMTSIGSQAFYGCSDLRTLSVPGSWEGTDMLTNASVPEGCTVVYRAVVQMQVVTYHGNGGTPGTQVRTNTVGEAYGAMPTATWAGHGVFAGWWTEASGGEKVTSNSVVTAEAERDLWAHWTTNQVTTFKGNGGTPATQKTTNTIGTAYGALPEAERDGWTFAGWWTKSSGGARISATNTVTTAAARTLYAQWTEIPKTLALELATGSVREDAGSVRCVVRRTGPLAAALVVSVGSSRAGDVSVPATVTIPAGARSGSFLATVVDNAAVDGTRTAVLSVSASGYEGASAELTVLDDEVPGLSLEAESGSVREGGTLRVLVSREGSTETALEVQLSGLPSGRVEGPSSVVIPAGARTAVFEVTVPDNEVAQAETAVTLRAGAAGYKAAALEFLVLDDDVPGVRLELHPEAVGEGAGANAVRATLARTDTSKGMDQAIRVRLAASPSGQVVVPEEVVIPARTSEVRFGITPVDNGNVDGERAVTIDGQILIASCGCGGQPSSGDAIRAVLTVLDNDVPALSLKAEPATMKECVQEAGWLVLGHNSALSEDLAVALSYDTAGEIEIPAMVTIPAGETSVRVPVKTLDDGVEDGAKLVSVYAEDPSGAFTGASTWLQVSDQNLPDLAVAWVEVPPTAVGGQRFAVRFAATNTGFAACARAVPYEVHVLRSRTVVPGSNTVAAAGTLQGGLAVGGTLEAELEVSAPELPGDAWVAVVLDPDGAVLELDNANNTGWSGAVGVAAAWTATVAADAETFLPGDTVTLAGKAVLAGGGAAAGVDVEVYLLIDGMRRTLAARTGTDGAFSTSWVPSSGEAGHYSAGACQPGAGSTAVQDEFDVLGMKRAEDGFLTCDMTVGDTVRTAIPLRNASGVALTGLSATAEGVPEGCEAAFEVADRMDGNGVATLYATVGATGVTEGESYEKFTIRVESAEGAVLEIPAWFHASSPRARLRATPASVSGNMTIGAARYVEIELANTGAAESGKITVSGADADWIRVVGGNAIASLGAGERAVLTLELTPGAELTPNRPLTGRLAVNCANGEGCGIPVSFTPVTETTGGVVVDAVDEYTFNTEAKPHLAGATVRLSNPWTGEVVASGQTGADGIWSGSGIPAGTWQLTVTAERHGTFAQGVTVEPGGTARVLAFLQFQAISATWEVVRTSVEDEYEVRLVLEYETGVPLPVVKLTMPDELPELEEGGMYAFTAVFENLGLVKALNVTLTPPEIPGHEFAIAENGFELPAGASKSVPVLFRRPKGVQGAARRDGEVIGGGEVVITTETTKCRYPYTLYHEYICGGTKRATAARLDMAHGRCEKLPLPVVPPDDIPTPVQPDDPPRQDVIPVEPVVPVGPGGGGIMVSRNDCDPEKTLLRRMVNTIKEARKSEDSCWNDILDGVMDAVTPAVESSEAGKTAALLLKTTGCADDVNVEDAFLEGTQASVQEDLAIRPLAEVMEDVYRDANAAGDLGMAGYRALTGAETVEILGGPKGVAIQDNGFYGYKGFSIRSDGSIQRTFSGFKAGLYEAVRANGDGQRPLVLAFAGTDGLLNAYDNEANLENYACNNSEQFDNALELADLLAANLPAGRPVSVVGHSLGGGLTEYVMLTSALGRRATGAATYNSSGMCAVNIGVYIDSCTEVASKVANYRAPNDPFSPVGFHVGGMKNLSGTSGHGVAGAGYNRPEFGFFGYWFNWGGSAALKMIGQTKKIRLLAGLYSTGKNIGECIAKIQIAMTEYLDRQGGKLLALKEAYKMLSEGVVPDNLRQISSNNVEEWVNRLSLSLLALPAAQDIRTGIWGGEQSGADLLEQVIASSRTRDSVVSPGDEWLAVPTDGQVEFWRGILQSLREETGTIDETELRGHCPAGLSEAAFAYAVERARNTIDRLADPSLAATGNEIDFERIARGRKVLETICRIAVERGFASPGEMWEDAVQGLGEYLDGEEAGVCASVRLQLSQSVALAREAFEGTLTLHNGHGSNAMENIRFDVAVTDEAGNPCNGLFGITDAGVSGMGGEGVVDAAAALAAQGTGTAKVLFVPTPEAAGETAKLYYFGGTLRYDDPFTGERVAMEMVPVGLTVNPTPELHLDYFVQRDVYGDDPFTKDVVEASLPAELAVLVRNEGWGDARDVRISSMQPEIVENEKGLAIDFRLSDYICDAMALNGATAHLGLNDVSLGTVTAKCATVAQWWLTASIQGHFTGVAAQVAQKNSWGNPDTSLIRDENVRVHKLIRSVVADVDTLPDFLTSEDKDLYGLPDTIWLSGSGEAVDVAPAGSVAVSGALGGAGASLSVTVTATAAGWTYGWAALPGAARYEIAKVVRGDGSEVPLRNAWITDRVFRDGADPKWETRLHIVDEGAAGKRSYAVTLAAKAGSGPAVVAFEGVEDGAVIAASPAAVTVVFSADVDGATFGTDDLILRRQGALVDVSGLAVSGAGMRWTISGLGSTCAVDGRYELVVQAAGIAGTDGVLGSNGRSVSWTVCGDTTGPVVLGVVRETGLQGEVFRVTLSEAAAAGPVAAGAVTLKRDGTAVTLPSGTVWEDDGNGGLLLRGLESVTGSDGTYVLTVSGKKLKDAAGNAGAGSASASWTVDTVAPAAVSGLRIDPDLGESGTDGATCEAAVTVRGTLAADVASVTVLARQGAGMETVLEGPFAPGSTNLACAVVLPGTGNLTLVVRCADATGNESDTEMEVYLDAVAASASWDAVEAGVSPVDRAVLRFDAPVVTEDVTAERLSLARNGRTLRLGDGVVVSPLAGAAAGTAFEVTGLAGWCARAGTYVLRFDAEGVRKTSSGLTSPAGAGASVEWTQAPAEVRVASFSARQRYPWNGLVDIDFEVVGDGAEAVDTWVEVAAREVETGNAMPMWSLTGDGADGPVALGTHRLTWNMGADRGGEFVSDALSVTMGARRGNAAYLVVDMSGGREAEKWPVSGLAGVPAGGWSDEYKTTKLVLRRVPAGTFAMGSPEDEAGRATDEVLHTVTLTRTYWMGVFEVTQKQWELAMGTHPAGCPGDMRPVESVSWRDIRGGTPGATWPGSGEVNEGSFLGVLREKTGMAFDLPMEAQWERACRAGSTAALNSGKALGDVVTCAEAGEVAKYAGNGPKHGADDGLGGGESAHAPVGSYRPNAWGLYDMHGNVGEWCLDWIGNYRNGIGTDPVGTATGVRRVVRGGSWADSALDCRSAARGESSPGNATDSVGFRLCWVGEELPDELEEDALLGAGGVWEGETSAFRADGRAGRGTMVPRDAEWAAWDTAWDGAASVEVTLTRPGGSTEWLGGASGTGVAGRGSASWRPRDGESGRYVLVHVSRDASGRETGRLTAEFVRELPLEVATMELPEAKAGEAYAAALEAVGGTPSYVWSLTVGRLPPGILLAEDGTLSGTPTGAGEYAFAVRVADAAGGEVTLVLAMRVVERVEWTVETPVAVPYVWLEAYPGHLSAYSGDYEAAAKGRAANGKTGWECYVAGLDPTDADADLKTRIEFRGGAPTVMPDPDLNEGGTKTNRVYGVLGSRSLTEGGWTEAPNPTEWEAKGYRFFRMTVKMPE